MSRKTKFSQELSSEIADELSKMFEREFPKNDNCAAARNKKHPSGVFLIFFACVFLWYVGKPSSGMIVTLTILASVNCFIVLADSKAFWLKNLPRF